MPRLPLKEPQPPEMPDEATGSPQQEVSDKWELTRQALDKLLHQFSADPQEAAELYERMRIKLIRFFEWRSSPSPEDQTDTTINRVARKIDSGVNIVNLAAYFFTVARLVLLESRRDPDRTSIPLDELPDLPDHEQFKDDEKEARSRCLDHCLGKLTVENSTLILKYYYYEKRAKIDVRKQLAEAMNTPMNALRIRVHRIRTVLEKCVTECLAHPVESK